MQMREPKITTVSSGELDEVEGMNVDLKIEVEKLNVSQLWIELKCCI